MPDSALRFGVVTERDAKDDKLVWIDCEMTGLELGRDALIEIAVLVTDSELNVLDEGLDIVIGCADDVLETMVPFVQQMHETSGLTELVRQSTVTLGQAEQQVLDYVKRFVPEARTAPLCGNSIATDRGFIIRDMPELDAYLHYRMIDVSSIKELARRWYRRVYFGQPAKGLAHRALADIHESVQELRYYRATIFVPPPGPTSEEAAAAAAAVLGVPVDAVPAAEALPAGASAETGAAAAAATLGAAAGAGSAAGPSLAAGAASAFSADPGPASSTAPASGPAPASGLTDGANPVVPKADQPLD
ncbi:MAG: oligoribonuclease [Pseudonocardiales bacterium]|nr:oligoribonuclease [Pseudonocardiales bacterium]